MRLVRRIIRARRTGDNEAKTWYGLRKKNPNAKLPPLSRQGAEALAEEYLDKGKDIPAEVFEGHPDLAKRYGIG